MNGLLQDVRYAARQLVRRPGLAAVALVTLALGIGANTAIFSVVHGVLLRPLPYESPDGLAIIRETNLSGDTTNASYPNFVEWRTDARSFGELAALQTTVVTLAGGEGAQRVLMALASRELFQVLGVRPALGRTFRAEEDRPGAEPILLLGYGIWRRQFGADTSLVGRRVRVNGEEFTVIGVMPPGFDFPTHGVELWAPLGLISDDLSNRAVHTLLVVGRLATGLGLAAANDEMDAIASRIQEAYPGEDPAHGAAVVSLHEAIVGDVRAALLILLGAVVFLLLIACTNVADLLLARAMSREREMAVRAALGAGRRRLLRQTLVESLLLSLAGGACGVALALWGLDVLAALVSTFVPRADTIGIDGAVLAFTLAVSVLTGVLFGLWPALRASRSDVASALRERVSTGAGGRRRWERQGLAAAQVAISLVLLTGAGLMLKSLWRVQGTDPGFDPERLLTMTVSLSGSEYDETDEVVGFYRDVSARLETLPAVSDVSAVNALPVSGGDSSGELTIEGRPFDPGESPSASFRRVLPSYFRVAGIPLLQGRGFTERDGRGGDMVVIISEEIARRYFPDGDAVGSRIKVGPPENEPWLTIVGVAADVRNEGLDIEPGLATYEPHAQRPWQTMNVLVRTAGDPHALAGPVREEIRALGGDVPIYDIATMRERISRSLAPRRLQAVLLAAFAAVAMILAAVGLYGVIAYSVGLRAREFGVRLALGAAPSDIGKLVLRQALLPIVLGATIGLIMASLLTRTLTGLLHQMSPNDPAVFATVLVTLVVVGLCASYVPSRRATRLQPMTVLRDE